MSLDHFQHRGDGGEWMLWYDAWGDVSGSATASTLSLPDNFVLPRRQPIGFRGAAPGESLDARGLPRVRVKAHGVHQ